ncbi:MAG: LPP20 family lipoprotein [Salinivirgaceae bacterium]|nr:LPP20 family lipoprotein [Salinivirgaceae bacterium]
MEVQNLNFLFIKKASVLVMSLFVSVVTLTQPAWVKHSPIDTDYYIGIGNALKSDNNYMDKARNTALARITSNITVSIVSETSNKVIEDAGIISQTFESNINSFAKSQLQGYEEFEKWENKKEYWVYYRLSKSKYKQIMMQKQLIAKKEASQYFKLGQTALKNNNIITALTFFAKAGNSIGSFRGMGIKNINEEMSSYLDVDIFIELNNILAALQITCTPNFIKSSKYASSFKKVNVEAKIMNANGTLIPFKDLPIKAQAPINKIEYNFIEPTNANGKTTFEIKKIYENGNFQVKIIPDIWALAGIDSKTAFYDAFAGLNLPSANVSINVIPANVFIQSNVTNFENITNNPITLIKAKQKITELNFIVTEFDDMADFILEANAQIRKGTEMQGIHTAFASGSIALIINSTGDEIFRKSLQEINGGGASFDLAGKQALERLSITMVDEIEKMLTLLQTEKK